MYNIHPTILQALVKYVLNESTSLMHSDGGSCPFDILSVLLVRCFHSQQRCLTSKDLKAKQLFESLDSAIIQLGQFAHSSLTSRFQEDEFATAAIKFVLATIAKVKLGHFNFCQHFSLITYLRPFILQLTPFFPTRLSSGLNTIDTVLGKFCNIFKKGSCIFGDLSDNCVMDILAENFLNFFGMTIEQHVADGLEFLFQGCKSCIIQSSCQGHLHGLSVDILSVLCYRVRPSDPFYDPLIEFVKTNLKVLSLLKQEIVLCDHIPGDALNAIAWDFATNPKFPESVREQALNCLDLNDPAKKQEIIQTKCRARTFELRLLGFKILLKASVQRSHSRWGASFVYAVQEIYQKTANESAENLNSIYSLLCSSFESLRSTDVGNSRASLASLLIPAECIEDFQVVFKKIACNYTSPRVSCDAAGDRSPSDDEIDVKSGGSFINLLEFLVQFAFQSADIMLNTLPEAECSLVQSWISFAIQIKFFQELQDSNTAPHKLARSFVLCYKPCFYGFDLFTDPRFDDNFKDQFLINCFIRGYNELGALYPNPEPDAVLLSVECDLSCLSVERLFSLIPKVTVSDRKSWIHTKIVPFLLLHWRNLDLRSNVQKGDVLKVPLEGDLKLFFKNIWNKWLKSECFYDAQLSVSINDAIISDSSKKQNSAARFIPIKKLGCMPPDLLTLTESFLDVFIRSDRARSVLRYWLAFHFTGSIVLYQNGKISNIFNRPQARPYVEALLQLCPSSAYIPFVNRFMMRFAQHLIPPQFLHLEPLGTKQTIAGIFLPVCPNKKSAKVRNISAKRRTDDVQNEVAVHTTILSVWMLAGRLHSCQTFSIKNQLLKTFSDSSLGNSQRIKALRRATRLPSLSVHDILKTIQPEFKAPPLQVSVIGGFVRASLDFREASNIRLITNWTTKESMFMYPDAVDLHMADVSEKLVSSGTFKCFVPIKVASDPSVTFIEFPVGSVSVEAIDGIVVSHIAAGKLSDVDICVGIERSFYSLTSVYELCFTWSVNAVKFSDARHVAIQSMLNQLKENFGIAFDAAIRQQKRILLQQSSTYSSSKAAFFRTVTFSCQETSETLVRECFDDNPVNLFPLMSSELSKAAIVACGYCKEPTACLDTLYSPRFLASNLSSAAVKLFEKSSSVFSHGSLVLFAEKLLFRNNIFFPPKVTIQKSIVRVLTANIDQSNSDIIMKIFRRCRHVSVLSLVISTCLRLLRTPSKIDLGKTLLVDIVKIAIKADSQSIGAFSKFCEVNFFNIRSFLQQNSLWNTPTRKELTQEWNDNADVTVDIQCLPWCVTAKASIACLT